MNNVAAVTPQITEVHNHNVSSRSGMVFTWFLVAILSVILIWYAAVFVLGRAGFKQPEEVLAQALFFFITGMVFLMGGLWIVNHFIMTPILSHKQVMAEIMRQYEIDRLKVAQQLPPEAASRMTAEDRRFVSLVKMVMAGAYENRLDQEGNLIRGRSEPWSRRSVGELTLYGEQKPIGETVLAGRVKPWLMEQGILIDDRKVDRVTFPDLIEVEAALIREFGQPIQVNL